MKEQTCEILVLDKPAIVFLLFATSISYYKEGASVPDWDEKANYLQKEQSAYVVSSSKHGSLIYTTMFFPEKI